MTLVLIGAWVVSRASAGAVDPAGLLPVGIVAVALLVVLSGVLALLRLGLAVRADTAAQAAAVRREAAALVAAAGELPELKDRLALQKDRLALEKDLLQAQNAVRTTLVQAFTSAAQLVLGSAVIGTLLFQWQNTQVAQQGQITERFTKAIDQLGSTVNDKGDPRLEIRLGGIYALERIARDSAPDQGPVGEVLTAYVRRNAPWPPPAGTPIPTSGTATPPATFGAPTASPRADIQAILTVLGRRDTRRGGNWSLGLSRTDLRGADLFGAHLEGVDFTEAHLEGADLHETHLERTEFFRAQLQGAILDSAHLEKAVLRDAQLQQAILVNAHLEGADLRGAHLEGAGLFGAKGLTQEMLRSAHIDDTTQLDFALAQEATKQVTPRSDP
jgi:uncharacterized protein YjbI with pentapeptide repeats